MNRKYLVIVAGIAASSALALEPTTESLQQNQNQQMTDTQFTAFDTSKEQMLAANTPPQNSAPTIQGTNAAGGSQTTIVDENGNLKVVDKQQSIVTNTPAPTAPVKPITGLPGQPTTSTALAPGQQVGTTTQPTNGTQMPGMNAPMQSTPPTMQTGTSMPASMTTPPSMAPGQAATTTTTTTTTAPMPGSN